MEGHFESHPDGAPLILFGLPDQEAQTVRYAIEIPKLSSLILKHGLNAPLAGLDTVPRADQPPVAIVFWSFRVMVAIGFLMLGVGLWSLWARWKRPALHRPLAAPRGAGDGRRPASSRSSPAGSPPRSGGSRSWSTA